MASATHSEVFNCSAEEFYKIISDYEKYPEFLSEVKGMKILKSEGGKKLVEYSVSMIKSFKYTCWMTEVAGASIHWEFANGDIFKKMSGSWVLQDQPGGKVKATYSVSADFSLFVPGPVANGLVSVNLPNMMNVYKKRVQQIYKK
jgi:coenzyme Q-binding protein COQ10